MAKLAAVVDSLDKVPEAVREMYTPAADGKSFVLDTDVTAHPGTLGLRDKNAEILRQQKALADKFKPFEGLDPEQVTAAMETARKAEEERQKREGDWAAREKALLEPLHKKVTAAEAERDEARSVIDRKVRDADIVAAVNAEDGNVALLRPILRDHTKVVKDGTEYVTQVVDAKGAQRYNGKGEPMTVRELVAEMKENDDYKSAFNAPGTTGTGARSNSGRGGTGDIVLRGDEAKDPVKYRRAKEEAAKRGVAVRFVD